MSPRVKAIEDYLEDVLIDYYGKEGVSKRASGGWVRIGTGGFLTIVLVVLMMMMAVVPATFGMEPEAMGICVAFSLMMAFFALVLFVSLAQVIRSSVTHPGWVRAYQASLADVIETVGHMLNGMGIEARIFNVVLRDLQFDARGAVFNARGIHIDISAWKDHRQPRRTIVHVSRHAKWDTSDARRIMRSIEERMTSLNQ